jgi:tRNA nucleotidyltransferase/poly(A) polymerase
MEPHEHGGTRTPYQLAQFVKKVGNLWDRIVDLSIADIRGTGQAKEEEFAKKEEYRKRLQSINPERVLQLKPLLSGNDLMTLLNIKPGKELGVIIQNLKEWQLQEYIKRGDIPSREEEETYIFNKFIKPFLNGNEVMVLLNISPGKQLGEIIKDLLNKQKNREITTKEQAEQYLLSKYK